MEYFAAAPSLLCGLLICWQDIRHRRVPRVLVLVGMLSQLAVSLCAWIYGAPWQLVCLPLGFAVLAGAFQATLALVRPGTLGFGDVTCAALMGQFVGLWGWTAFILWWLLMGVLGLAWIGWWQRYRHARGQRHSSAARNELRPVQPVVMDLAPFAPVIVTAAIAAVPMVIGARGA